MLQHGRVGLLVITEAIAILARSPQFEPQVHEQVDVVGVFLVGLLEEVEVPLDLVAAFDHLGLVAMVDELSVAEEVLHRPLFTV